jgi:hypothetical protein
MTTTLGDRGAPPPSPPSDWASPPRRRRVPFRKTWMVLGSVFALASVGWGVFQIVGMFAYDKTHFHQTFDVTTSARVQSLDIGNNVGSVKVIGSDRPDIVIEGVVLRGLIKPSHREVVVGNVLEMHASCRTGATNFCSVDYEIQVPRDVDVRVRASGAGIRVSNVTGDIDLSSSGGAVRVEGSSGALRLHSSGGGVSGIGLHSTVVDASSSGGGVELEFLSEPTNVRATSSGGGVTVVIPDTDVAYRIEATSSGGSVSREVRSDPAASRRIHVSSSGGSVTVRYPEPISP